MKRKPLLPGLLLFLIVLAASCRADSTATKALVSDSTPSTPEECREILFTYSNVHTSRSGGFNIFAICPGDTVPRMVTYGDNYNESPRWSPDRSQIAYLSNNSGKGQLHIMDRDGGNDLQLTFDSDLDTDDVIFMPDGSREIVELFWLPEGDRVAVALRGHEGLIWQAVDLATGEITPLDDMFLPSSNNAWSMSLSHDGRRIAYTERTKKEDGDSPVEIFIQDVDDSNLYQLTTTGWNIKNPIWSPDDSQIAFLSSSEYNPDQDPNYPIQNAIYMVNLDGSNLHEPIITGINPTNIAWSPDGQSLAAIASEMHITGDIFNPEKALLTLNILNIRTGERIILFQTDHPNRIYDLSW